MCGGRNDGDDGGRREETRPNTGGWVKKDEGPGWTTWGNPFVRLVRWVRA